MYVCSVSKVLQTPGLVSEMDDWLSRDLANLILTYLERGMRRIRIGHQESKAFTCRLFANLECAPYSTIPVVCKLCTVGS
jgi:hypothetical protein